MRRPTVAARWLPCRGGRPDGALGTVAVGVWVVVLILLHLRGGRPTGSPWAAFMESRAMGVGCPESAGMVLVMGDGLKPLTTIQVPTESSQAATGRAASDARRTAGRHPRRGLR